MAGGCCLPSSSIQGKVRFSATVGEITDRLYISPIESFMALSTASASTASAHLRGPWRPCTSLNPGTVLPASSSCSTRARIALHQSSMIGMILSLDASVAGSLGGTGVSRSAKSAASRAMPVSLDTRASSAGQVALALQNRHASSPGTRGASGCSVTLAAARTFSPKASRSSTEITHSDTWPRRGWLMISRTVLCL